MLYKAITLAALFAGALGQLNETTTTTTRAPTSETSSPTKAPTGSPTKSPTSSPTIDLGSDEVVIEVDVTLIGADVTKQCKGDGFKKAFRKSYKSGLLSIYSSAVGASDEQVDDKFVDGCKVATATTGEAANVDTSIYGEDGITVTFKLSSEDANLLNTFDQRWKPTFVDSFAQQVFLLFENPVAVDYEKTEEREAAKGTLSRNSDIASDGEKFGSIWLLPGIMLMIAGGVFAFQTRSIIDPDGVEDNDRADRLRGERAKFEREFGPLNPDDADGDMIQHDLPPPEHVRAVEMETVGSSSEIVRKEGGGESTGGASTTSGGAGESKAKDTKDVKKADMKVKKTEKAADTTEIAEAKPDKSSDTASTAAAGAAVVAGAGAAAATTSESGEAQGKKTDDPAPQPVPDEPKEIPSEPAKTAEEPVAEAAPAYDAAADEPAAEEPAAVEEAPAAADDAAPAGAPASVVATAKGHGAQPSASESFDPSKFDTKEEAQAATQTYLDNLWDDADGDALPDGDEDADSSAEYA